MRTFDMLQIHTHDHTFQDSYHVNTLLLEFQEKPMTEWSWRFKLDHRQKRC